MANGSKYARRPYRSRAGSLRFGKVDGAGATVITAPFGQAIGVGIEQMVPRFASPGPIAYRNEVFDRLIGVTSGATRIAVDFVPIGGTRIARREVYRMGGPLNGADPKSRLLPVGVRAVTPRHWTPMAA